MVDRFSLVPPCEATLPCHDICHIFDEIDTHGLIRYRNLFKFERMNSFMKQILKNRAHGIASIMKNYNTHEKTTMSGSLYLENVVRFHNLCKLHPSNGLPFQSLSSYVTSIHVEPKEETGEDMTKLYDIPSSNVIEFRGSSFDVILLSDDINCLLEDNIDIMYEENSSVLKLIMKGYYRYREKYPDRFKDNMLAYTRFLLDGKNLSDYNKTIGNYVRRIRDNIARRVANEDLVTLTRLTVDMTEPKITVR
jgi:hypothetical protein